MLVLSMLPALGWCDALMRTEAMLAPTIAEIYVEEDGVRMQLEIGLSDIELFQNLLPDEIHRELGFSGASFAERLQTFLSDQWQLRADGESLPGSLLSIGPASRVRRDNVTGEPLPDTGEPETVVVAQFEWPFERIPERLEILYSLRAVVGYVVYHEKVAVNDFRYLAGRQQLVLDWEDPWYSQFETRSLRRTYFAGMAGFIYVEPFEVRKEIIVRPKDLQRWMDLGLEGRDTIPVEMQPELIRAAVEFLAAHQPVTIDGARAEPSYTRANFLERTLQTSRVIDPPVELDINNAILGIISVYPHVGFADKVTMQWDLFDEKTQLVPAAGVDPLGALPTLLEPRLPVLEWENFIRIPVMPEMVELGAPPSMLARWSLLARWPLTVILVALTGLLAWRVVRGLGIGHTWALVFLLASLGTGAGWWLGKQARLDEAAVRDVVTGLLTNVYRAFDYRNEEQVYDVLSRSVDGELLRDVYLEMRRGLVLAAQGGASAKVKTLDLVELQGEPADHHGVLADATWQVNASVGHWGHLHERRNQYRARLRLQPIDGAWKLVQVEILDEVRL